MINEHYTGYLYQEGWRNGTGYTKYEGRMAVNILLQFIILINKVIYTVRSFYS